MVDGKVLALAFLFTSAALAAPPPPGPLPDWPCREADAGALTAASVLPAALAARVPVDAGWQADARAKALADFVAAPENTPDMGIARIAAFARDAGGETQRELLLALDGILVRVNQLRDFVREGIADKVAQSRLLADEVAGNDREIAALPADASPERRRALAEARRRNAGALHDRAEDADLLCHRLDYTARKVRLLAGAIARHIEGAN